MVGIGALKKYLLKKGKQFTQNLAEKCSPTPPAAGSNALVAPGWSECSSSFSKSAAGCVACLQINGQFIDFGPSLSQIGSKLSEESLFDSILYPSAAISHGFHGVTVRKTGSEPITGFSSSETQETVTMRLAGGVSQAMPVKEIAGRAMMESSLMPTGLTAALTATELADLVAYLQSLK